MVSRTYEDMKMWRYGYTDICIHVNGDIEICRYGDMDMWRHRDIEILRYEDIDIWR